MGGDDEVLSMYADLFNCRIGHFPMKYLGGPVSFTSLRVADWDFMEGRFA